MIQLKIPINECKINYNEDNLDNLLIPSQYCLKAIKKPKVKNNFSIAWIGDTSAYPNMGILENVRIAEALRDQNDKEWFLFENVSIVKDQIQFDKKKLKKWNMRAGLAPIRLNDEGIAMESDGSVSQGYLPASSGSSVGSMTAASTSSSSNVSGGGMGGTGATSASGGGMGG